jgi:acyl-CoA thioesterase FadM
MDSSNENLMVTLKIEVKYRQPTPTLTPLTIVGRIESVTGSKARTHGEIHLPDGTVSAEADLLLARPPADFRARWENEKQYWRVYTDA